MRGWVIAALAALTTASCTASRQPIIETVENSPGKDGWVEIQSIASPDSVRLVIANVSDKTLSVIWDESSIIVSGAAHRIVHKGVKVKDSSLAMPNSVIPAGTRFEDTVYSDELIVLETTDPAITALTGAPPVTQLVTYGWIACPPDARCPMHKAQREINDRFRSDCYSSGDSSPACLDRVAGAFNSGGLALSLAISDGKEKREYRIRHEVKGFAPKGQ